MLSKRIISSVPGHCSYIDIRGFLASSNRQDVMRTPLSSSILGPLLVKAIRKLETEILLRDREISL